MSFQDINVNYLSDNLFPHGDDLMNPLGNYYQPSSNTNLSSGLATLNLNNSSYSDNNYQLPEPIEPIISNGCTELNYKNDTDDFSHDIQAWRMKHPKHWNGVDIVEWINYEAQELTICPTEFSSEKFACHDGDQLCGFTKNDFEKYEKKYGGMLYKKLKTIKAKQDCYITYEQLTVPSKDSKQANREDTEPVLTCLEKSESSKSDSYSSNLNASNSSLDVSDMQLIEPESPPPKPKQKQGRGRPKGPTKRKKKPEKLGRLWEFLRDLLKNKEYCPTLITWDNYEEGMFRFVHSDKVAKLWGTKKDNPDMNYEKLSRAMRYYYKSKVLQPVYGRRLVYKFGPTATGWKVDNPNFKD